MAIEKRKRQQNTPKQMFEKQFAFSLFQIQNLQELVGRADSKAQFILGANAVLFSATAALFPDLHSVLSQSGLVVIITYSGLLIIFAITGLISMIEAFWVVYPSSSPLSPKSLKLAIGQLLYFRAIVHSYDSSTEYHQSLVQSSPQDILANASQQIYSLSRVAGKKYDLLRASTRWLIFSLATWVLNLIIILIDTLLF